MTERKNDANVTKTKLSNECVVLAARGGGETDAVVLMQLSAVFGSLKTNAILWTLFFFQRGCCRFTCICVNPIGFVVGPDCGFC